MEQISILEYCRRQLHFLSPGVTEYDTEIEQLIAQARADMVAHGVKKSKAANDREPLVRGAIALYVKANFGSDNPDAARLAESYDSLVTLLKSSVAYGQVLSHE